MFSAGVPMRKAFLVAVVLSLCMMTGVVRPVSTVSAAGEGPLRIAVLYFDNYSITDREGLEPFRKGLADTLISSLAGSEGLQVVERTRMDALLSELALHQTGAVTDETVQKVGKILGVKALLMGSYTAVGTMLRIDARLVDVETSRVMVSEETCGSADDFFSMEESLVDRILRSLRRKGPARAEKKTGEESFEALLLYSRGLDALDRKDEKAAAQIAGELHRKYPAFPVENRGLREAGRRP